MIPYELRRALEGSEMRGMIRPSTVQSMCDARYAIRNIRVQND
jgi:hypothetical protein